MAAVHTFVAEVTANLINALETTYDESLQIKLCCDTEVEINVESIVMSDERTSACATRNLLEYRSLDLGEASLVKDLAHGAHDLGTLQEHILHAIVDDEVKITLTIAELWIIETVVSHTILVLHDRKRTDRFREDCEFRAMNADLASLCAEYITLHAHKVANVEKLLEHCIVHHRILWIWTEGIARHIDLHTTLRILQLHESSLTHDTAAHDTSGNAHLTTHYCRILTFSDINEVRLDLV